MLCQRCKDNYEDSPVYDPIYGDRSYHLTVSEIKPSSSHCPICSAIWDLFSDSEYGPSSGQGFQMRLDRSNPESSIANSDMRRTFHFAQTEDESKYIKNIFWNSSVFLDETSIRSHLRRSPLPERMDSETILELASTWLKTCVSSHPRCNRRIADARMPTRLLELGTPSPEHIRLRITSESDLEAPYMTLSHCWGSIKFLTLTAGNAKQLLAGICLSSLPQTFQDAVKVAKRLGAQFLWIDSLCIFQDSVDDWQREASSMGNVYRNSLCNIAATAAADGSVGFFNDRNSHFPDPKVIAVGSSGHYTDFYHIYSDRYQESTLEHEQPLLSRGWVVQERILPARVLHFGTRQTFWECCTMTACESFPQGLPLSLSNQEGILKLNDPFGGRGDVHPPGAETFSEFEERIYRYWAKVVQIYSMCNLTRQEDKLVAISGVSKVLNSLLGNDMKYLAGLWRPNIIPELLWFRNPKKPGLRPISYRAPTWSWASLDGEVAIYNWTRFSFDVTMTDFNICFVGNDTFGQVESGLIRLYGPFFSLEILSKSTQWSREYRASMNNQKTNIPEEQLVFDVPTYTPFGEKLHMMPFISRDPHVIGRFRPQIIGLLLLPTGIKRGQFRRLGYALFDEPISIVAGALNWAEVQNHDWFEYESFDGVNKYTISVI